MFRPLWRLTIHPAYRRIFQSNRTVRKPKAQKEADLLPKEQNWDSHEFFHLIWLYPDSL
ncbi:MAG: hypothetical protein P8L36_09635 [SAR324 cluster bacterium]|nr:hypothetical protein [SAR324 cluster bacterium]